MNRYTNTAMNMFNFLGWNGADRYVVDGILNTSNRAKGNLYDILSTSEKWNGNLLMVMDEIDAFRSVNRAKVNEFADWFGKNMLVLKPEDVYLYQNYNMLFDDCQSVIDEGKAKLINNIVGKYGGTRRFNEGQKLTKAVEYIGKLCGLDKIKDMQEITWTTSDGVEHSRMKDFGWNGKKAEFGDAIVPKKDKRKICVSINPIDFWTASKGKNWQSCHTIDKWNEWDCGDSEHHYSGCYCGGTTSYMLDEVSFVVYYLNADYNGDEPFLEDKYKRCMFHYKNGVLVQGRVYPDGRNADAETDTAKEMREYVMNLIANALEVNNSWTRQRYIGDFVKDESEGVQYHDYFHYSDCNVNTLDSVWDSVWNDYGGRMTIGSAPICISCGEYHNYEDSLTCQTCGY